MPRVILLALLSVAMQLFSRAQSKDTSYHILCYKGKKVREDVLLTPAGDTIYFNASKNTLKKVSKTGQGKELDKMLLEVNKTSARIDEMIQKISAGVSKQVVPYYAKPLKDAYEEVQQAYSNALSNTVQIPEFSGNNSIATSTGKGPFADIANELDDAVEQTISRIQAYMQAHKDDKFENLPVPPIKNLRYCAQCDKKAKDNYKKACEEFEQKLFGEDKAIALEILSLERKIQMEAEKKPVAAGSEGYAESVVTRLSPVLHFLMVRNLKKAKKLIAQYKDDPFRCQEVCVVALSLERQRQLLLGDAIPETITYPDGFVIHVEQSDAEGTDLDVLPGVIETAYKMIEKAMMEFDYALALNPVFILTIERQKQLLGLSEDTHEEDIFSKYLKFNRFKLNIHISGKLSGKDYYQVAELKGDNYFAAAPDPNDTLTCGLKWILLGPDPAVKHMKFELLNAKMLGNGGELTYAGTKNWKSNPPKLKINFCNNGDDTAEIYSFQPDMGKETWIIPKYGPTDMGAMSNVLLGCFMDVDRLKKEANMANAEKMKQQMMEEYQKFQKNYSAANASSQSQMNSMMNMAKALSNGSKVAEIAGDHAVGSYLLKPTIQNKSKVVFKERLNGKELFPQNSATEYAWLDVMFEEDAGNQ